MPSYELSMILRQMPRVSVVTTLKRCAECIWNRGGVIRNLENLGTRPLPYKISEHGLVHREGTYFAITFNSSPEKLSDLNEEFGRDVDIIRRRIYKLEEASPYECLLHEEMQPPAYRKDVQDMIEAGKKKQKGKFAYNSGLDYYPFQK